MTLKHAVRPSLALLPLLAAAFALTGCGFIKMAKPSSLKKPTFDYADYKTSNADDDKTDLEFKLTSINPNGVELKNVTLSYELFYEEKKILTGKDVDMTLKPNDTARISVPNKIVFKDVFNAVGSDAEKKIIERKSIPIRIEAVLSCTPTVYDFEPGAIFHFDERVSHTVDVSLPEQFGDKVKREVTKAFKKMFSGSK